MSPLLFLRWAVGIVLIFAAFVAQLVAEVFEGFAVGAFGLAERVLP